VRKRVVVGGIVALAVVVVGGGIAARSLGGQTPTVTYLTAQAAVADIVDTVSVTGSVAPVSTYGLAFGQAPVRNPKPSATGSSTSPTAQQWTVASVTVKAGDPVVAGAVLAKADTSDAEATLATAQLNLDAAKAKLALDSKPVTATNKAKAKLAITQANRALSQARSSESQTASNGRLAISQAQAVLSDAQKKLSDDQGSGALPPVISADEAAVKAAQRALASARQQAATANLQATAAVQTAQLNVQSAQLAYQGTTSVNVDAAVAADRAQISQAETAVSNAQETLDRLTLTAPIDGTVSSVTIQEGDVVSGTVITMRSADVEVDASVTETDLPAVKAGQTAAVTINALGASVQGTVSKVDLAGATKSASGVVSYAVTIAIPKPPAGVAPSMTADVDITTATAAGVIAVPASAIAGSPGAYTVQVYDGPGQAHSVAVQVGLMTATQAEVKSGLAAGTTVVTGVATAKDLVTTFPAGPPGSTKSPSPSSGS
jgi:macrolide-specific efflux system membrane fusion protein